MILEGGSIHVDGEGNLFYMIMKICVMPCLFQLLLKGVNPLARPLQVRGTLLQAFRIRYSLLKELQNQHKKFTKYQEEIK